MKKAFSIRESIKTAWQLINNENLFLLIGLYLGFLIIYGLLYTVPMVSPGGISTLFAGLLMPFTYVVFSLGFVKICLQITKGEEPVFKAFKDVLPLFVRYILASILVSLPLILGSIIGGVCVGYFVQSFAHISPEQLMDPEALIKGLNLTTVVLPIGLIYLISMVPAIYLGIRWMFFPYYIVDKNAKIVDSLTQSWKSTDGHFGHLLLMWIAFIGMYILGTIALIIGVFVAIPVVAMVKTVVYQKLDKARQPKEVIEPVQSEIQQ